MALSPIEQKGDGVTERFSGGPMPQRTYVPGPHPPAEVEVRELTERQVVPLTEAALYRVFSQAWDHARPPGRGRHMSTLRCLVIHGTTQALPQQSQGQRSGRGGSGC